MPSKSTISLPTKPTNSRISMRKLLIKVGCVSLAIIIGIIASVFIWYKVQLGSVGSDIGQLKKVTIVSGSSSSQIGDILEEQSIIRSSFVFEVYVRLHGKSGNLKPGVYRLSPAETMPQIVEHLVNGSVDTFNITFYPGATLTDNTSSEDKKYDVKTVLRDAGYSDTEISTALSKTYDSPLFDGKPSTADLEGYIYGETYTFDAGATVEDILQRTFDEYYQQIEDNNIIAGLSEHGLNLYQGITLASIVQREVSSPAGQKTPTTDQKQVAQVFYSRLSAGMVLGSDVTYQYIADKTGVARDPSLDSPYNTRLYAGLPPGPIAVPDITSLIAVANPANTDYLYFLSGDDDVTYFAHTYAEHEANITDHCKVKCSTS